MKKILRNLAMIVVAILCAVACTESDIESDVDVDVDVESPVVIPDNYNIVLYASVAEPISTKVEFADNDAEGISLAWEVGDSFTVYKGSTEVGTFICDDAENGIFKGNVALLTGVTYTAEFGSNDIYEQNGDDINNIDKSCYMTAEFTYGNDDVIMFEHQMALITLEFESEERPAKLIFESGDEVYIITYNTLEPIEGIYTSNIMINEYRYETRLLTFTFYNAEGIIYDIRTTTVYDSCYAGYRYTISISDFESPTWDGDGSGTESDPYLIKNATDLRDLSTKVNSGTSYDGRHFLVTQNIDLGGESNEFTAIGYWTNNYYQSSFKGYFDGGGYEISGLYINKPDANYQGLFGYAYNGTIKNTIVKNPSVIGNQYVGAICGYINSKVAISNCGVEGGSVSGNSDYVGGVIGYTDSYSTSTMCYNTSTVLGSNDYVGGVIGYVGASSTMTECYNIGEVSGESYVGGVMGYTNSNCKDITACYNVGKVSGSKYVGGVMGYSGSNNSITACYNIGTVSGTGSYVGGVIGYLSNGTSSTYATLYNIITECYNTGTVSGTSYVGGVIGNAGHGLVATTCYNTGTISGSGVWIGGVFGTIGASASGVYSYDADMSECYNTGKVSGKSYVGGVAGSAISATVTSCQNTGDVLGIDIYVGGIVGYYGTITACNNTGNIKGDSRVGGVVGYSGTTTACGNTGEVSGTSYVGGVKSNGSATACYNTGKVSGTDYVGGIVASASNIIACYNVGEVSGSSYVGAIAGILTGSSSYTITTCYYNSTIYSGDAVGYIDVGTVTDVESMTTEDMKASSFVSLLNGVIEESYWKADYTPNINDGYPIFSWQ